MKMTYGLIKTLSIEYPVRLLCSILGVCFSVFYAWKRGETHVLSEKKEELAKQVKEVFEEHRSRYGAIRISKELKARDVKIGRHQTQTLMIKQGLKAIQPKSFVPKTTNSNHNLGRSPNLLLDRAAPTKPNEVFVGDITYIALVDGSFLYLATWLDMFSRKIVGWDLADHMRSSLVINALNKSIERRSLVKGLIIHSDGGGQYASEDFRKILEKHEFSQSMTRRNNHYDNAMGESLFSRFKAELMQKGAFLNFQDAYTEIFEYIELYYNRKRRHSGINYDIPDLFEEKFQRTQTNIVTLK
jgi:putative transposase